MAAKPLRITFADGSTVDVQPTLEDRLRFESTLRKNKGWGKLEDNALKLIPFQAWSAAQRTGKTELTWDQFTTGATAALDVSAVEDDEESVEMFDGSRAGSTLEVDDLGEGIPTVDSSIYPSSSD